MKIVNWSFVTSHEWDIDHPECIKPLIADDYYPFKNLTKEATAVRKGAIFLRCPAHTDFLKNTFVLCAPFDITLDIDINDQGYSKVFAENLDQDVFDKIIDLRFLYNHERGNDPYPLIGIDWLNTFTCDSSMLMQVLPAFMHRNDFTDKATLIPGQFDISQWIRPAELVFEVKQNKERIVIKQGDAIAYFKFFSDEIVKLVEQPTPWKEIRQCNDIRSADKFRPLKERYESFDKVRKCPYEPKN
jgi:hypothetical protein